MATIILKGTDKKIETTISEARKINHLKESKADSKTLLNLNGLVLELGDIRYAMYDEDKDRELTKEQSGIDTENYYKKIDKDFRDEIFNYLNGGLNKKIEFNLKVASFYCYTFTGLWLKEWSQVNDMTDLSNLIKKELETEKLVVSPKNYKNIFKVVEVKTSNDSLANSTYMGRQAPLKMMENYLYNVYHLIK